MSGALSALDPHKAVLPVIAVIGLVPVVARYRKESKWFVVGYALLVVATLATNLENLFLGTVLNYTEHVVGLLASGIAFLAAGYIRRRQIDETGDSGGDPAEPPGSGEATSPGESEIAADGGASG
jgi:hypothetical protein